jgi:hypothetical protein
MGKVCPDHDLVSFARRPLAFSECGNIGMRAKWMAKLPQTRFLKRTSEAIGPAAGIAATPQLSLDKLFHSILYVLHTGMQWEQRQTNRNELHYTNVYTWHNRWSKDGASQALFAASGMHLHHPDQLDTSVLHGDGSPTVVKKGAKVLAPPAIHTRKATKSAPSWTTTALFSARFRSNPSTNTIRALCPKPSPPL